MEAGHVGKHTELIITGWRTGTSGKVNVYQQLGRLRFISKIVELWPRRKVHK